MSLSSILTIVVSVVAALIAFIALIRKRHENLVQQRSKVQSECSLVLDSIEQGITDITQKCTVKLGQDVNDIKSRAIDALNDLKEVALRVQSISYGVKTTEENDNLLKIVQELRNSTASIYHGLVRSLEHSFRTKEMESLLETWERLEVDKGVIEEDLKMAQSEFEKVTAELRKAEAELEAEKNEQIRQMV